MEAQVRRVFENLRAIIEAAGGGFAQVAKLNIFLTDLSHFALVNKIMSEYFTEPYPGPVTRTGAVKMPSVTVYPLDHASSPARQPAVRVWLIFHRSSSDPKERRAASVLAVACSP